MKRLALAGMLCVALSASALAVNITNTPVVGPTETGENSQNSQSVLDMARFKPGFGTATISISGAAGAGTLNTASGILTLTTATAGASGASPSVVTLTNSKVQATDMVDCTVDQTGATAGSVLSCNAHVPSAGTITLTLYDATPTALTSSTVILEFLIVTSGNPN